MNEYREEFSLRREGGTFPMCTMKPTIHGAASAVRRLSRNTCESPAWRFSAVKYGRRKPPCCSTCYPILFMSEYSKTLRCPHAPCHPLSSLLPSPNCLFKHSPVISGHFRKREAVSEPYAFIGPSQECETATKRCKRLGKRIFSKRYKKNKINRLELNILVTTSGPY